MSDVLVKLCRGSLALHNLLALPVKTLARNVKRELRARAI